MAPHHKHPIATTHPDLVAELVRPAEALDYTAGSAVKLEWLCNGSERLPESHTYWSTPNSRTQGHGCPYCANMRVQPGLNDLATTHPDVAALLDDNGLGSTITAGHTTPVTWRCDGTADAPHPPFLFTKSVRDKLRGTAPCAVCAGRAVLPGFNDLATTHPGLADELVDPAAAERLRPGSNKQVAWSCSGSAERPHPPIEYSASVKSRTRDGGGCPYCRNRRVMPGFNDLATTHPDLADQLVDSARATEMTAGSSALVSWTCSGTPARPHATQTYRAEVKARTARSVGCPYCANRRVLPGFNDLASTHPDLTAQLVRERVGEQLTAGSSRSVEWKCVAGHRWSATVTARVNGTGCPSCAERGFDQTRPGWLYLMERPGELQIGITNSLADRVATHSRDGWALLDSHGPFDGASLLRCERALRHWIKSVPGRIPGTWERWPSSTASVSHLSELLRLANVDHPQRSTPPPMPS